MSDAHGGGHGGGGHGGGGHGGSAKKKSGGGGDHGGKGGGGGGGGMLTGILVLGLAINVFPSMKGWFKTEAVGQQTEPVAGEDTFETNWDFGRPEQPEAATAADQQKLAAWLAQPLQPGQGRTGEFDIPDQPDAWSAWISIPPGAEYRLSDHLNLGYDIQAKSGYRTSVLFKGEMAFGVEMQAFRVRRMSGATDPVGLPHKLRVIVFRSKP